MQKKSVLITGAAKRIGKELALHMAQTGWHIAVHYNNSGDGADELEKATSKLVSKAVDGIGELTCLINNASVFENDKLKNLKSEAWHKHIQVNLHSPLILAHEFVEQLRGKGNIINMLDYCVLSLPDKFLSYAISKSGLWAATQILAKDLAPNVRVNGIGPGHTLPNIRESQAGFEKAYKATPLQIQSTPEEICRAI
ncbi:MAG: fabG, partial [Rickettsiaceae bacterium]|nr:fabG [Rickettsiaceae bacterium]